MHITMLLEMAAEGDPDAIVLGHARRKVRQRRLAGLLAAARRAAMHFVASRPLA